MTNPQQTFKDARLKVERADCHIREYTETIIAFLKTDFCKLTVEEDGDTGHYLIKADATPLSIHAPSYHWGISCTIFGRHLITSS